MTTATCKKIALSFTCALAGCATTQTPAPKPGVQVIYRDVKIPVSVPCVLAKDIPTEPERVTGKLTGDPRRDLDTISANAIRLRSWGRVMYAMLGGCANP